jgi:hypothetical protein
VITHAIIRALRVFRQVLVGDNRKPVSLYVDGLLGEMVWSATADGWVGIANSIRYVISYQGDSTPDQLVLEYAKQMLLPNKLMDAIEQAKPTAIQENQRLSEEIHGLRLGTVHIGTDGKRGGIFAELEGGRHDRSWRVEFNEEHCEGIGFDT